MDPQAAWDQMLKAYLEGDLHRVQTLAADLQHWLQRGGFAPVTHSIIPKDDPWHRTISDAACTFLLRLQGSSP